MRVRHPGVVGELGGRQREVHRPVGAVIDRERRGRPEVAVADDAKLADGRVQGPADKKWGGHRRHRDVERGVGRGDGEGRVRGGRRADRHERERVVHPLRLDLAVEAGGRDGVVDVADEGGLVGQVGRRAGVHDQGVVEGGRSRYGDGHRRRPRAERHEKRQVAVELARGGGGRQSEQAD